MQEATEKVEREEGDGRVVGGEAREHLLLVHAGDGGGARVEHDVRAPLRRQAEGRVSAGGDMDATSRVVR